MTRIIKISAIAVLSLLALFVIAAAILAATFNPNDYKPWLIQQVAEKKHRTLAIPGEIKLSFFPKLGIDLGEVSLSEYKSPKEFVSVKHAKVSLEFLPLLKKQLVVDQISVDGLRAQIQRQKDGTSNFDDLLAKEEPSSSQQLQFDIDGVEMTNASLRFDDQQARRTVELSNMNLQTGKIANGVPSKLALQGDIKSTQPVVAASLAVNTGFTMDLDKKQYTLRNADAQIKGQLLDFTDALVTFAGNADLKPNEKQFALDDVKFSAQGKRAAQRMEARIDAPKLAVTESQVTGGNIKGDAKLTEGKRTIAVKFDAPTFSGSPQAFAIPAISLDATIREDKLDASAKVSGAFKGDIDQLLFTSPQLKLILAGKQGDTAIDGSLSTPLSINLKNQLIDLPSLAASFSLPNPGGGALKLDAAGRMQVNLGKPSLTTALKGRLDESSFDARLSMPQFSPAAYQFDVDIDRLDADRYRSKEPVGNAAAAPSGQAKQAAPAKPIDLSGLRAVNANGSVRIGNLKVNNIKASNVRADLRAGDGKIDISSLTANLYGGSATGALSATASAMPRFTVRQNLVGIHVGPLLKDAIGKSPVEGRGNVSLDVTSAGGSVDQIKKSLNGSARLALQDGAIHGINLAQAIRNAKARIGELRGKEAAQTGTASATEKTDFSEMSGSFRIANGVARNDDLAIKSPLLRIGGAGDVNLGEDRLDYLVKATIVSTLQGQGGPELQAMKGLTIPVRLSGPFAAISWRVDFGGLVQEAAKQKIEEKKEEFKNKAREQLQEQFKGWLNKQR